MTFGNDRKELRKGEKLVVTVGEVYHNTILVFLEYRKVKFCGVLLNTSNRSGPYGILETPADSYYKAYGINPEDLKAKEAMEVLETDPTPRFPPTIMTRTTYAQKVEHPPARQIYQRRRRSKRKVRMDMMDTDLALKMMNTNSTRKLLTHLPSCCCDSCATGGRDPDLAEDKPTKGKRKLMPTFKKLEEKQGGWSDGVKSTSKDSKRIKLDKKNEKPSSVTGKSRSESEGVKRSPVIKISYKSPGGKGQVLKIPSRIHSPPPSSKDPQKNAMHERARKAVIRARSEHFKYLKEKTEVGGKISKMKLKSSKDSKELVRGKQNPRKDGNKDSASSGKNADNTTSSRQKSDLPQKLTTVEQSVTETSSYISETGAESDKIAQNNFNGKKESPDTLARRQLRAAPQVLLQSIRTDRGDVDFSDSGKIFGVQTGRSQSNKVGKLSGVDQDDSDSIAGTSTGGKKKESPVSHTITVTRCTTKEGVQWCQGDVVWAKIMGFPWWPGVLRKIVVKKDGNSIEQIAIVDWFQSKTVSHIPCSALESFSGSFKKRYSKKLKGNYKKAIQDAREAENNMSPEVRKLIVQFET